MSRPLAARLRDTCHLTGTFVLRSGATSTEYFDKFLFTADPALVREICEAMAALVPAGVEALAGIQLGGVPLTAVLSQVTGTPARYVRLAKKAYGTQRLAEGGEVRGVRLAIVEDVITTGGQVIESAAALRAEGGVVEHVLCVVDRESGGRDNLAREGLELRSLFGYSELVSA